MSNYQMVNAYIEKENYEYINTIRKRYNLASDHDAISKIIQDHKEML